MAAERINLSQGGVSVSLNAAECAELHEIQRKRDEVMRGYTEEWQALFDRACERSGVGYRAVSLEGAQSVADILGMITGEKGDDAAR